MVVSTIEVSGPAMSAPMVHRAGFNGTDEIPDKPPEGKGPHFTSADTAQPVYLIFDSDSPASAVVSFAVVPPPIATDMDVTGGVGASSAVPSSSSPSAPASVPSSSTAGTADSPATPTATPQPEYHTEPSSVTLERYKWKTPHTHNALSQLVTSNSRSVTLSLTSGRQVYKIVPSAPGTFSLSVAFPKSFGGVAKIAREKETLEFFGMVLCLLSF